VSNVTYNNEVCPLGIVLFLLTTPFRYPFKFAQTELKKENSKDFVTAGKDLHGVDSGTIVLKVYPATASLPTERDVSYKHNLPNGQLVDKIENEGKKFWKLPSVTSTFDETKATLMSGTTTYYTATTNIPSMTVTAYYHSPALIAVLKRIHSDHEEEDVDDVEDVIIPVVKKQKTSSKAKSSASSSSSSSVILRRSERNMAVTIIPPPPPIPPVTIDLTAEEDEEDEAED